MGRWREGRDFSKQFKREHRRNPSIKELEEFRLQQLGAERVSNEEFARRLEQGSLSKMYRLLFTRPASC